MRHNLAVILAVLASVVLPVAIVSGLLVFSTKEQAPQAHVLVMRNPNGTITMQEFSNRLRCEYAVGLAKGLSDSTIGDCAEK